MLLSVLKKKCGEICDFKKSNSVSNCDFSRSVTLFCSFKKSNVILIDVTNVFT